MSVRFRFSLKAVMITAAVISVLLGYTQWRRIRLMHEARELKSEGFYLLWDGSASLDGSDGCRIGFGPSSLRRQPPNTT